MDENSAPMTTEPAVPVTFMLGANAVARLEAFATEARISPEEAIRFAVAQFLSHQDGLAMLILSGHTRAAQQEGAEAEKDRIHPVGESTS